MPLLMKQSLGFRNPKKFHFVKAFINAEGMMNYKRNNKLKEQAGLVQDYAGIQRKKEEKEEDLLCALRLFFLPQLSPTWFK